MGTAGEAGSFWLFRNDREAVFLRRPNRFLIIADGGPGVGEIACHCPNPGRLVEFAFPGARLILEKRDQGDGDGAKTGYTAVGVYHEDHVAPLFAARANGAARALILRRVIPGLTTARPEYALGASRFDFYCEDCQGRRHLVEVKACSLVEYGTAMFPDAPSGRALKHLEELAALAREGYVCHVLFVIVHGSPDRFVPNLHTDPALAAALCRYGGDDAARRDKPVRVHAALLRANAQGEAVLAAPRVPVDLSIGGLAESNRGSYLIALELPEPREIPVGALGTLRFEPGWYVYAGSAQGNLAERTARHLRRTRKRRHWHIDYLTPFARTITALPIMSYRNLECSLAADLAGLGGRPAPGFGASDCRCGSHLYYFSRAPLENRAFVDLLLRYRHHEFSRVDGESRPVRALAALTVTAPLPRSPAGRTTGP